ncbi:hypothetical protein [Bacteroides ihuae]|uniref:hypothetical protein n=1 Tax=Bacteroides ihuae TaxID=1852362 RepID=UPI0008DB1276|nr:hypothetical protein [Bacteroides ihuae]
MKTLRAIFSLAIILFGATTTFAQANERDNSNATNMNINANVNSSNINVWFNDSGAIYPVYLLNPITEQTQIKEVWDYISNFLGTTFFDLYYNAQKLSLYNSFKDYWIVGNVSVILIVKRR